MSHKSNGLIKLPQFKCIFAKQLIAVILLLLVIFLTSCGGHVHHRVEKGESLYSIGFYYGQDYQDIAEWNGIARPYTINEGQWLRVAPPVKEWWEESGNSSVKKQPRRDNKITKRSDNKYNKNNKLTKKRVVIAEDFTDKHSPVKKWIWPTKGVLTKNSKDMSLNKNGINIEGKRGQPIVATASGKVVYSGSGLKGYGQLIIIKHNKHYLSAYAYNEKMLVREGDMVSQGQKIALMGQHIRDKQDLLHFEIRKNGKPVNPLRLLAK